MLKIKSLKISGFRGILTPKELDLTKDNKPCSFVLYGLNSSGKTSFVDGIEWFLSQENKIDWLRRDEAQEQAYAHQEAASRGISSYVETTFLDKEGPVVLRKVLNPLKLKLPELHPEKEFEKVYNNFVIRPYLRYLEVIDFVYNKTGAEKYQKLANWMGFEKELAFQEKIAIDIIPAVNKSKKNQLETVERLSQSLKTLMNKTTQKASLSESEVVQYCTTIIKSYSKKIIKNIDEVIKEVVEIEKKKTTSDAALKVAQMANIETNLISQILQNSYSEIEDLKSNVDNLMAEQGAVKGIDIIDLYTLANEQLIGTEEIRVPCPVCGTTWDKTGLLKHIKDELALLERFKQSKAFIQEKATALKTNLQRDMQSLLVYKTNYENATKTGVPILNAKLLSYGKNIKEIIQALSENYLSSGINFNIKKEDFNDVLVEKEENLKKIAEEKTKIQPSEKDIKTANDIQTIKKILEIFEIYTNEKGAYLHLETEIEKLTNICLELSKNIQENISERFNQTSGLIGEYFSILRNDKKIEKIEIVLKTSGGKAAGRSAEIQLSYFDIVVKPAYKVLSESLLNSLGLAVYLACIRQFNAQSKFIILDDIMNSLDLGHRNTLLDLLQEKFSDYQVILLTHDLFWFELIQRRFPEWKHKKIKNWDYLNGPNIEISKLSREEIADLLLDSTKAVDAARKFTHNLEGILNVLCENLQAKIKYRFIKNDPPSMEELFTGLHKRLEDKLKKEHPVVLAILKAKKIEPLLRNFSSHTRDSYAATISQDEVKSAITDWQAVEDLIYCKECNQYINFIQETDSLECKCKKLTLEKVKTVLK